MTNMETPEQKKQLSSQELVMQMYEQLQNQKKQIESAEKGRFITDGMFKYGNNTAVIDIRTVKNVSSLVEMYAFLLEKESFNSKAAEKLGVTTEFTWLGAGVEDWKNDISIRVNQINIVEKRKKFNELESRILKIASPDFLMELEAKAIAAELGM